MQGSTQFEKAMKMAAWITTAKKNKHPIYKGKFWIYEEKRLASYDEWRNFYERQANEKQG
jgi:hypothetical protein